MGVRSELEPAPKTDGELKRTQANIELCLFINILHHHANKRLSALSKFVNQIEVYCNVVPSAIPTG